MSLGAAVALPSAERATIRPWRAAVAVLVPLAAVTGVGAANGGFFPTSFGWTALAFAWGSVIAIAFLAPAWGPLDKAWALAAAALCVFTFLSALWAGSVGDAVDEGFRSLVYLTGVAGALLVLRRRDIGFWLGGLVLGVTAVSFYSLATRLFPNHFGAFNAGTVYRLFVPIGYWNALGIFAAMAALLALGLAVNGRTPALRVLVAAALVVLLPTLYYTYSRGSWGALVVGLLVALGYSPWRERLFVGLFVFGPLPAIAVWLASRPHALTDTSSSASLAARAGHRVAVEIALLALIQVVVAVVYIVGAARIRISRSLRRGLAVVLAVAVVVALVGVFARYGSPSTLAHRAYHEFTGPPTSGQNLNSRLFSLSSNGRTVLWRAAWNEFRAHPVAGGGAGSFQRWWFAHRKTGYLVEDAHNLYAQTLGELGLVGGVLLALFLGLPLVAAARARRHPLVATALGAYVAYLVHCIVDWDWQMPAVTLLGLFSGAAIVVVARGDRRGSPLGRQVRIGIGTVAGVAAVVAFVGLIGNIALARSERALADVNGKIAVAQAKKAHRWAPWSTEALRELGESEILVGNRKRGLADLRHAAAKDSADWETWYDIASATSGTERAHAVARVKALDPAAPELALLDHPPAAAKS